MIYTAYEMIPGRGRGRILRDGPGTDMVAGPELHFGDTVLPDPFSDGEVIRGYLPGHELTANLGGILCRCSGIRDFYPIYANRTALWG